MVASQEEPWLNVSSTNVTRPSDTSNGALT